MAGIADVAKQSGNRPEAVKAMFDAVAALTTTEHVIIKGFGSFKTTARAARTGRNPQTGETLQIAAKEVLTFKATK